MSPQWAVDVDELFVGCLYRIDAVKYEKGSFWDVCIAATVKKGNK